LSTGIGVAQSLWYPSLGSPAAVNGQDRTGDRHPGVACEKRRHRRDLVDLHKSLGRLRREQHVVDDPNAVALTDPRAGGVIGPGTAMRCSRVQGLGRSSATPLSSGWIYRPRTICVPPNAKPPRGSSERYLRESQR